VQVLSNLDLFRIIQSGIPDTGMPAFHNLSDSEIQDVVRYLRDLQGKRSDKKTPGDPGRGKSIFFGKAACDSCHVVGGRGGFSAANLSGFASIHTKKEISDAIAKRTSNSSWTRLFTVTTLDGQKYSGVVRNEDNFSLQLQAKDGTFYFFQNSDLQAVERNSEAPMPDYGSILSKGEIDDLVGFLIEAARTGDSGDASKDSE
jgi:cytochrome c oxidase cbb3-type subunit III